MRVKIKTWDEMVKEFNISSGPIETIKCDCGFIRRMENSLPEDRMIEIKEDKGKMVWFVPEKEEEWVITKDMISEYTK